MNVETANSIAGILKDFTPGAVGVWSGVFMFAAWWLREWRETRKLSAEDRLARRDGYAKQVEMLLGENRELREELHSLQDRHDLYRQTCHAETDGLRQMIIRLENDVAGFKRRVDSQSIEIARMKGLPLPPGIDP